jgi:hypothetical protein
MYWDMDCQSIIVVIELMSKNAYTLEEALDFLDIPKEERSLYIEIFAS